LSRFTELVIRQTGEPMWLTSHSKART